MQAARQPIERCIERWHAVLRGELTLDAVLHPDVVFYSPIVFTPQRGREITTLYLTAAGGTLAGSAPTTPQQGITIGDETAFRYVTQICQGHHAMLEFETTVDATSVNGVDVITCDDEAMITEFKVMIRPLKAINLVHAQMKAMIEALS